MKLNEKTKQKNTVIKGATAIFGEKGLKFTMDEVAKSCHISKKTIYALFASKEDLIIAMLDYCFESIKESERAVYNDSELSLIEKIKKIMIILPDGYHDMDFKQVVNLKYEYPAVYEKLAYHLENDWELTIELLNEGVRQGIVRPVCIPVLRAMIGGTIESILGGDMLDKENMTYNEALEQMMDIVMSGISERQG